MVLDSIFGRLRDNVRAKLKNGFAQITFDGINVALTFALVAVAWIPFRANNFADAWYIFTHLLTGCTHWLNLGAASIQFRGMGVTVVEFIYCAASVALVVFYDIVDSRRNVWDLLKTSPRPVRWAVSYALLILVLFFGPYNQAQNFIYFQF